MELDKKIEAILFWKGEPISRKKLGEILDAKLSEINEAIEKLKNNLNGRGIVILEKDNDIMFGTAGELSDLIENLQKEELKKDLSKSALEVLSIVLYKNGVSRSEIDYIRGVNSSFTLRMLLTRGLIEKILDPNDNRRYVYRPSFELLSYMGIKKIEELPEYTEIVNSIDKAGENLKEDLKKDASS